jgi:hypothetical protein
MQRKFSYLPKPASKFDKIFGVRKARQRDDDDDDDEFLNGVAEGVIDDDDRREAEEEARNGDDGDRDNDDDGDARRRVGNFPSDTFEQGIAGGYYYRNKADHLNRVVAALRLANPQLSEQRAMAWLLHTARGRALSLHLRKRAERQQQTKRKESPMTAENIQETLRAEVAKRGSLVALAKTMVKENRDYGISEFAFSEMVGDYARANKRAGETSAGAFARIFSADSDEGLAIRRAHALTKAGFPQPTQAVVTPMSGGREQPALEQLNGLTRKMMAARPELSEARAFELVYTDPANIELAKRERMENRPSAGR